jgi:hypothetical protein
VAPGITSLPTTPAVVNGQMTVTNVVPVWNQTELLTAGTRTGITLQSYGYAFAVTTALELKTRTGVTNARTTLVEVPNAQFVVTAPVPAVASSSNNINVPLATIAINGIVPSQIGRPRTTVSIPSKAISVVAKVPSVLSGSAVGVPAATVRISVPYLYVDTGKDPGGQTPGIPDLYTPTQDWQPEPWAS